jgi:hypothetical protein
MLSAKNNRLNESIKEQNFMNMNTTSLTSPLSAEDESTTKRSFMTFSATLAEKITQIIRLLQVV